MNPYDSPEINIEQSQPAKPGAIKKIDVMQAFKYPLAGPNATMNIVWCSLCIAVGMVIPVVGPLILLGYQALTIVQLTRGGPQAAVDFDSGKFMDYLKMGVWPFLVALVAQLVLSPLMVIAYIPMFIGVFVGGPMMATDGGAVTGMLCMVFGVGIFIVAIFALTGLASLLMVPIMLRAGLTQDFGSGFNLEFIKDFARKTWKDVLIAMLLASLLAWLISTLGTMCCLVGIFPAGGYLTIAFAHLQYQMYQLYLSRGGQEIPIKAEVFG